MRWWVFASGFGLYWLLSLGLPLWDDDFTSWIRPGWHQSVAEVLWHLVSPISTQAQHWGFNDRPLELLHYKLGYALSGWNGWGYWLLKSMWMGGMLAGVYGWLERLKCRRGLALLLVWFVASAPPTMAAFLWHADFAPASECLFVWLSGWFYDLSQRPSGPGWTRRAFGLALLTFLAYKSKADLKLLPVVLAFFVAWSGDRKRWLGPIVLMLLLAVPWGPGMLQPRRGAAWMWQLPDLRHVGEFFWSSQPWKWDAPTMSLAALLGPFVVVALLFGRRPESRPVVFVALWLMAVTLALSVLPVLPHTFRIRYAILPLVPVTLLLGAWLGRARFAPLIGLLVLAQSGLNGVRSWKYRQDLGGLIVVVDQAWGRVNESFPQDSLVLVDVLPFNYRPDQAPVLETKTSVRQFSELAGKVPGKTYAVSWTPTLWEQVELVECYRSGPYSLHLYRFIGADPLWSAGRYQEFLKKYPGSQAAQFALAFAELQNKQWQAAETRLEGLQRDFPENRAVLYNRAFARQGLGDYRGALERYQELERGGSDAGIRYNSEICRKALAGT